MESGPGSGKVEAVSTSQQWEELGMTYLKVSILPWVDFVLFCTFVLTLTFFFFFLIAA